MGKTIRPAPDGQGTYAELDGDNTYTGDNVFESIQSDEITVGRETGVVAQTSIIAASADDFGLKGAVFQDDETTSAVGFGSAGEFLSGYRFTGLNIPQGSTISSAQLNLFAAALDPDTIGWKIGVVNSTHPISPISAGTWPDQDTLYDYPNQDSGSLVGTTEHEVINFPTADTGTTFLEAIQSLVNDDSWDASSSIQIIISDEGTIPNRGISFRTFDSVLTAGETPQLSIVYSGIEYVDVAAVTDNAPRVVLPDTLYGVVGDTLQLFIRGMVEMQDPYSLPVIVSSTIGNAFPRYFEVTPTTDTNVELTVSVLSTDYTTISTKTVPLVITSTAGNISPALNKNFLMLGDSITFSGEWPTELNRMLTDTFDSGTPKALGKANITFVGDDDMDTSGFDAVSPAAAAYTGVGGWRFKEYNGNTSLVAYELTDPLHTQDKTIAGTTWTASDGGTWYVEYVDGAPNDKIKVHVATGSTSSVMPEAPDVLTLGGETNIDYTVVTATTASPFWDVAGDKLDFTVWQARNVAVGETLDAVYVLLGWNGITDWNETADMTEVRIFLQALNADLPLCKVRIIGIQVPSPTGGLGDDYLSDSGRGQYYPTLLTANNLNIAYQALANEAVYSSWVEFIGMMPQLDAEYNYTSVSTDVNTRNSTTQELIGDNGIHPSDDGKDQIADAVYRQFVHEFLV